MKILAIETSGKACGAAVLEDGRLICEIYLNDSFTHSKKLMPMVEQCLMNAGCGIEEIDVFAVTTGPGSFTGLRIGICAVKGMAQAYNKPVCGVSSLETLAKAAGAKKTAALIDARNDNAYAAYFEDGKCLCEKAAHIDEILETFPLAEDTLFLGDGAEVLKAKIAEKLPKAAFGGAMFAYPRAGVTAQIAYEKAMKNELTSLYELEANYMRPSQAERMKNGI